MRSCAHCTAHRPGSNSMGLEDISVPHYRCRLVQHCAGNTGQLLPTRSEYDRHAVHSAAARTGDTGQLQVRCCSRPSDSGSTHWKPLFCNHCSTAGLIFGFPCLLFFPFPVMISTVFDRMPTERERMLHMVQSTVQ